MISKQRLESLWSTKSVAQIAEHLGETKQAIYYWGRYHELALPGRQDPDNVEEPSADVIKERAAEIRARWTPAEYESRLVGNSRSEKRWEVPNYRVERKGRAIVLEAAKSE